MQSTLLFSKVLLKETTKLQSRSGTVTPPPSPTSGQSLAPARAVLDVEGLATGTSEVCTATLEVLAHLFSWIDVTGSVSTNLLDAIFTCAKYHDAMVGFYSCRCHFHMCSSDKTNYTFVNVFTEWQAN